MLPGENNMDHSVQSLKTSHGDSIAKWFSFTYSCIKTSFIFNLLQTEKNSTAEYNNVCSDWNKAKLLAINRLSQDTIQTKILFQMYLPDVNFFLSQYKKRNVPLQN